MIKNMIKLIGLFSLIVFGFFYTDKVINVIKEDDEIMVKINNIKSSYESSPVNGSITSNTIIPGISGSVVNVDKSYKKMKINGVFNNKLLVFDIIKPDISIENNKDKFIIKGNSSKLMVSMLFILNSNRLLDKFNKILNDNGVIANYFVDYDYLIDNSTSIKKLSNHEVYSYGNNGNYSPDNLLFSNNLISRISNNDAIYCLSNNMNKEVLSLCNKNNLYTIVPNIILNNNSYSTIKNNISNGSIILIAMNIDNLNELNVIIDYIKKKGYDIVGLSKLLSE